MVLCLLYRKVSHSQAIHQDVHDVCKWLLSSGLALVHTRTRAHTSARKQAPHRFKSAETKCIQIRIGSILPILAGWSLKMLSPSYRWVAQGTERLNNSLKDTQVVVSLRLKIRNRVTPPLGGQNVTISTRGTMKKCNQASWSDPSALPFLIQLTSPPNQPRLGPCTPHCSRWRPWPWSHPKKKALHSFQIHSAPWVGKICLGSPAAKTHRGRVTRWAMLTALTRTPPCQALDGWPHPGGVLPVLWHQDTNREGF